MEKACSPRIKKLRRTLPLRENGHLLVDLFTTVFFDEKGAWLVAPEGVFRAFRTAKGWCAWERKAIAPAALVEWATQIDGSR